MDFQKMSIKMLADLAATASGPMIRLWCEDAQSGLDKALVFGQEPGSVQFFREAIACLDAEMAKRAQSATVPPPVMELLRHMSEVDLITVRSRVTRTTVPQHDELRAMRVANFIKAINDELSARDKVATPPKDDPFAEFAASVPEDLRHFFTEKSKEGPTRTEAPKPGAGMVFQLAELNYLCSAVAEYQDDSEEIDRTIGVPLYQRLQQIRQLLADLLAT